MPPRRCLAYGLICEPSFEWTWCPVSAAAESQVFLRLHTLGLYENFPHLWDLHARVLAVDTDYSLKA